MKLLKHWYAFFYLGQEKITNYESKISLGIIAANTKKEAFIDSQGGKL